MIMFVRCISRSFFSRPCVGNICLRNKGSGDLVEKVQANKNTQWSFLQNQHQHRKEVIQGHKFCTQVHRVQFLLTEVNKNSNFMRCFYKHHTSNGYTNINASVFLLNGGKKLLRKTTIVVIAVISYGVYYFYNTFSLPPLLSSPVHAAEPRNKNNFIADVVEKAGPAVVFLEIKGKHPLTGRPVTLSNGSGFIVRNYGIIITNAHVVANKSTVIVKLKDGRVMEGQVTAVDPISDLAAVKIPAKDLPVIPLGDSSDIRPGEWVIAMGSPLSLSNTVTCGIVSSVQRASRELGLRNKDMDYIQTDAVINFGNSGGPLVNMDGKAIGINTMKVTTGISFAIPADYAIKFLNKAEAVMKTGKTDNGFLKRRYMGITMLTLTENVMRGLKSNIKMPSFPDIDGGVFVYKVIPGSPAYIGGILAGDIIIDIGGTAMKSAADVYDAVEKSAILEVTVIRGSKKEVIKVNTQETI
jgi:HtrA serine peptidase 2